MVRGHVVLVLTFFRFGFRDSGGRVRLGFDLLILGHIFLHEDIVFRESKLCLGFPLLEALVDFADEETLPEFRSVRFVQDGGVYLHDYHLPGLVKDEEPVQVAYNARLTCGIVV